MSIKATPAPANPRLYKSPDSDVIRVELDDGRVARVGPEWRTLELDFHNMAVRRGCVVKTQVNGGAVSAKDAVVEKPKAAAASPGTDDAVRTGLIAMLSRDEPSDFNEATGLPDLKALSKLCGFAVDPEQAGRVLRALKLELEAGDAKDADGNVVQVVQTAEEVDADTAKRNKRRDELTKKAKRAQKTGERGRRSAQSA